MKKDTILHIVLLSIIAVLSFFSLYFLSLYYSVDDSFRNTFLSGIRIFNPEFTIQDASPKEVPAPGAMHVPILIYHSVRPHLLFETELLNRYTVSPAAFEKQLQYLKANNYTVVGLDYLDDALIEKIELPPKTVVLTFDDGWQNQYVYAFSLLKKYGYTATFFVYTDAIGNRGFLTWDEIKEMDNAGMTIGGHTESHPYLAQIDDPGTLREEISGGKKIIDSNLGRPTTLFAYPFGYYNDQIIKIVKEAGYTLARSTHKGAYHTPDDLYKLKGIEVTDDLNKLEKDLNN
jgi:peptidoglycan/xylan/chitin deacetylase (PgdA/CDA1 family)